MKWHVSNLPEFDVIVNPSGKMLKQYIPTVFTTARRDFPKYLANCEGIARFYHKERMCVEIDGQETLFITPKDIFLNHYIFGTSLIASALRCSHLEKQIIKVIEKNGQLTKQELQRHLRTYNVNVTLRIIENHLKHLADLGYLNVDKPKRENFYSVSEFYNEFSVDPDFNEIVEYIKERMRTIEQYKPYAEEYIERFCSEEAMNVIDPITGETINMLTYEFDKPHEVQLQNEDKIDSSTRMKKQEGQLRLF